MDARVLPAALLVVASCGGSTSVAEPAGAVALVSRTSCIASYSTRPCELLTEDIVRAHAPVTGPLERVDAEQRRAQLGLKSRSARGVIANGCTYSWKGGRTNSGTAMPGRSPNANPAVAAAMEKMARSIPVDDRVEVRSIQVFADADPLARFAAKWRAPTAEERAQLERQMDEAMEKARQEGKLTGAGARTGRQVGRSFTRAQVTYEPVEGVGTAARWGGIGSERALMVLDQDTEFVVVVSVSNDEAANRAAAIAIARDLLGRCGN